MILPSTRLQRCAQYGGLVILLSLSVAAGAVEFERGRDLLPVFARAHAGEPLRAAAIGGSITQAGGGWIETWLREQFPRAAVTMRNAGMSATGSALGVFRLERDVISAQPDLVLIEFAVNDGGASDEDAIRYTESIVVRLKSLPHPPAIVFVEAAARGGSKRHRHQHIAAHYGLLDIDLQVALDRHLEETGADWASLMGDDVHPNASGHAFFAETIARALAPYVEAGRASGGRGQESVQGGLRTPCSGCAAPAVLADSEAVVDLPSPLSSKPLLLDGRLVPLDVQPGWGKQHSLSRWWDMLLTGVISADKPGTELVLPVRGTSVGLFYALEKDVYGSFYVNLDGNEPRLVDTGFRGGYTYTILGKDLEPCEHLVRLAVAMPIGRETAPVKLGYLLVAGETDASATLAPQGPFNPVDTAQRTFTAIPAKAWEWSGPYGGAEKTIGPTADLDTAFAPEAADSVDDWQPLEGSEAVVDLAGLTGQSDRGVCYIRTTLERPEGGQTLFALRIDYFGKLWVNGELVRTIDSSHGHPGTPLLIPVTLRAGPNTLLLKVHSGSGGNMAALAVAEGEEGESF